MNECIDLKQEFGCRYQIAADPSARSENTDPWLWTIPCQFGEIYPYGGKLLCAAVRDLGVVKKLRHRPELTILQDAEDIVVFRFHLDDFEKVAEQMRAKKQSLTSFETEPRVGSSTVSRTSSKGKARLSRTGTTKETLTPGRHS